MKKLFFLLPYIMLLELKKEELKPEKMYDAERNLFFFRSVSFFLVNQVNVLWDNLKSWRETCTDKNTRCAQEVKRNSQVVLESLSWWDKMKKGSNEKIRRQPEKIVWEGRQVKDNGNGRKGFEPKNWRTKSCGRFLQKKPQ